MENFEVFTVGKPHLLRDKTFQFAVRMVRLYSFLTVEKKEYIMSKQVLRCGTNPGAMIREALNAESDLDFIHKLGIAQKETAETQYWLELLFATKYLEEKEFLSLYHDVLEIMKITRSTILTKKKNIGIKASILILAILTLSNFLL